MTTHPVPEPALVPVEPPVESGVELLWPPLTTWQVREDLVGFDETEDEIDHWVYEIE